MNEIINLGNGQFVKVTMLKGERGSNIATITKTGTSGLVDTYTITLTDGSTTSFEVQNGSSIDHITKTSSVGSVDTYTIYLTDGTVGGTFEVNNAIATVEQNFSSTSTNPLMNKTLTNVIAGVENGSTASKTYYANDLILRNDSLYEVTTTVAVGTAWADGVNITEKTLGELISELNADLTELSDCDLLWSGKFTTSKAAYTLSKSLANYRQVAIVWNSGASVDVGISSEYYDSIPVSVLSTRFIDTSLFMWTLTRYAVAGAGDWIRVAYKNTNQLTVYCGSTTAAQYAYIYGIK